VVNSAEFCSPVSFNCQLPTRGGQCNQGGRMVSKAQELVRILELAASYNDKGVVWSGHSQAKGGQMRDAWQSEIDSTLSEMGQASIPAALVNALRSGEAVEDSMGTYASQARERAQNLS
jgi:hypothetical protein